MGNIELWSCFSRFFDFAVDQFQHQIMPTFSDRSFYSWNSRPLSFQIFLFDLRPSTSVSSHWIRRISSWKCHEFCFLRFTCHWGLRTFSCHCLPRRPSLVSSWEGLWSQSPKCSTQMMQISNDRNPIQNNESTMNPSSKHALDAEKTSNFVPVKWQTSPRICKSTRFTKA